MLVMSVCLFVGGRFRANQARVDPTRPGTAETQRTERGWVQAARRENQRGGPTNGDRVQPLDVALGQWALGQKGLGRVTLAARAPADVMSLVVIMPPPPSRPDPMVLTDGFCSLCAVRPVDCYLLFRLFKIGHSRTQLTRTHFSMSYHSNRFLKTFRTGRKLKGST
jgi:hypothetical protein